MTNEAPVSAEAAPAAVAAEAPAPTTGSGFLAPGAPAAAAPTSTPAETPQLFSDSVIENGSFREGWAESLKEQGFERLANKGMLAKDPRMFLKSLDEALGMVGRKNAGTYPKAGASDEDVAIFRREAGVPDSPEGYDLKPASLPDGVTFSEEEVGAYAQILHKHHVPAAAAKELAEFHAQQAAAQAQSAAQAYDTRIGELQQQSDEVYRQEWGDSFDARLESNRAFALTRFSQEELADPVVRAALSHPKIVRLVDEARRAFRGEGSLPGAGAEVQQHSMSPRQQALEIIKANPRYQQDPELVRKVGELYRMDAIQRSSKRR